MKKKKSKWIIIAVIVLILAAIFVVINKTKNASQGISVEVSEVTRMDIVQTVETL